MTTETHIPVPSDAVQRVGRALRGSTREQRGVAFAAALAFFGVAYLGPAFKRWTTPKTRAERLADEAAFQAETFRRGARRASGRIRKQARRLGGGPYGSR